MLFQIIKYFVKRKLWHQAWLHGEFFVEENIIDRLSYNIYAKIRIFGYVIAIVSIASIIWWNINYLTYTIIGILPQLPIKPPTLPPELFRPSYWYQEPTTIIEQIMDLLYFLCDCLYKHFVLIMYFMGTDGYFLSPRLSGCSDLHDFYCSIGHAVLARLGILFLEFYGHIETLLEWDTLYVGLLDFEQLYRQLIEYFNLHSYCIKELEKLLELYATDPDQKAVIYEKLLRLEPKFRLLVSMDKKVTFFPPNTFKGFNHLLLGDHIVYLMQKSNATKANIPELFNTYQDFLNKVKP